MPGGSTDGTFCVSAGNTEPKNLWDVVATINKKLLSDGLMLQFRQYQLPWDSSTCMKIKQLILA